MAATINLSDIPDDQRKELGIRKPREQRFTQDEVRSYALRALATLASLTRAERARVLRHSLKVNAV